MKEYRIMLRVDDEWYTGKVGFYHSKYFKSRKAAEKQIELLKDKQERRGKTSIDEYKIVCREVTEWVDA